MKAKDFLNSLFDSKEEVRLRAFSDRKEEGKIPKKYKVKVEEFSTIEKELEELNRNNYGIFFVVNSGGDKDADINKINAQFIEIDNKSIKEQKKLIKQFPLKPSMVIQTRKSLHVYWFIKDGKVDEFRKVQKALIKHFDSDPSGVNESRVMRLPGFYHCKEEPILVELLYLNPELRYTQQQLLEVLDSSDNNEEETFNNNTLKEGAKNIVSNCDFLKYCAENSKVLPEPLWFSMIELLAPFENGEEIIKQLSKDYPNYSEKETVEKIRYCRDNHYHAPTCEKLSELGFICRKREQGICSCHTPIDLKKQSLPLKDVSLKLNTASITGVIETDIKIAKKFIDNYLLNMEESSGNRFISGELLKHFRFDDKEIVKDLKKYYSQKKSEQYYKEKYNLENLPEWYIFKCNNKAELSTGTLAEHITSKEHILYVARAFHIYKNGVYKFVDKEVIEKIILNKVFKKDRKSKDVGDVLEQVSIINYLPIEKINSNPAILNLKNGLYNTKTKTLEDHTPDYYSLNQLNANYDDSADCPTFKKFLLEATDGDEAQIKLIQEVMGYLLIPENAAQKAFIITGAAAAGKSLLANTITYLLDDKNVSKVPLQDLDKRFKSSLIFGKLANIVAELPTTNIVDNSMFKRIVGGDPVIGERRFKDEFDFIPTARLLFTCNSIPLNYSDRSEGFYRRLLIIPFNKTIPEEKRDKGLLDKFKAEIDGILQFALEGLERLQSNDYIFTETDKNKEMLNKYKVESDSTLSFIKERCKVDKNEHLFSSSKSLYTQYKSYCEDAGMIPCSMNKFINRITTDYNLERTTRNNKRGILGIEVIDEYKVDDNFPFS